MSLMQKPPPSVTAMIGSEKKMTRASDQVNDAATGFSVTPAM